MIDQSGLDLSLKILTIIGALFTIYLSLLLRKIKRAKK